MSQVILFIGADKAPDLFTNLRSSLTKGGKRVYSSRNPGTAEDTHYWASGMNASYVLLTNTTRKDAHELGELFGDEDVTIIAGVPLQEALEAPTSPFLARVQAIGRALRFRQ